MTHEKIREIVANQLSIGIERVVDEANLVTDLGADSLDAVEMIMALEEEFSIEISDQDADKIATIEMLIVAVEKEIGDDS